MLPKGIHYLLNEWLIMQNKNELKYTGFMLMDVYRQIWSIFPTNLKFKTRLWNVSIKFISKINFSRYNPGPHMLIYIWYFDSFMTCLQVKAVSMRLVSVYFQKQPWPCISWQYLLMLHDKIHYTIASYRSSVDINHTVTAVVIQETNKFSHKEISVIELDSIVVWCNT